MYLSSKNVLPLLLSAMAVAFMISFSFVYAGDKTLVCHYTSSDTNPTVEIAISDSALQTHLDHGDTLFSEGNGCGPDNPGEQ